jgi:acetamidase/formamidase
MPSHHRLTAAPEHVAWGYLDAAVPPVLAVDSGDTVTIEAVSASDWTEAPADPKRVLPDHRKILETVPRGPGPHILTGPVEVRGAEAGDVLQIDVLDVSLRQDWGYCAIKPLMGTIPEEFPDRETVVIDIDMTAKVAKLPWGVDLPLAPFFGIIAVAPPRAWGRQTSVVPRAFGGNMDNKSLGAGTTLYLPVFNDGALFWAGDGHGVQGDGEVCLTALETALTGTFRLTVRKDMQLVGPFAETATHLISIGIDEDLDDAARKAVSNMVRAVCERSNLSRSQAYMLCSLAGDLKVTQTVDVHKGIHMVLPKATFSAKA